MPGVRDGGTRPDVAGYALVMSMCPVYRHPGSDSHGGPSTVSKSAYAPHSVSKSDHPMCPKFLRRLGRLSR